MRIVVVDDQPSQLAGRVHWLTTVAGADVSGLTFEQALALGPQWRGVDVVVLDGHDRRSPARRADAAADARIEPIPDHDVFPGVRVAAAVRAECGRRRPTIILVSSYARDSEIRARRIAQAGVDYAFEHYEVEVDAATFVRAVLDPASFSPDARAGVFGAGPAVAALDVAGAVAILEESPARDLLLGDAPYKRHRDLEWSVRTLREALAAALPGEAPPLAGPRRRRAPTRAMLGAQLRQALGLDLPRDPA
jgi:CheY-like chemotaxis protein